MHAGSPAQSESAQSGCKSQSLSTPSLQLLSNGSHSMHAGRPWQEKSSQSVKPLQSLSRPSRQERSTRWSGMQPQAGLPAQSGSAQSKRPSQSSSRPSLQLVSISVHSSPHSGRGRQSLSVQSILPSQSLSRPSLQFVSKAVQNPQVGWATHWSSSQSVRRSQSLSIPSAQFSANKLERLGLLSSQSPPPHMSEGSPSLSWSRIGPAPEQVFVASSQVTVPHSGGTSQAGCVVQPTPSAQMSVPLQKMPSSHTESSGCVEQPRPSTQLSVVHAMPSSQIGGPPAMQLPPARTHASWPLHSKPSSHCSSEEHWRSKQPLSGVQILGGTH